MGIVKALLRVYSYIFEGILWLFVLGIAGLAVVSNSPLNLAFLPRNGPALSFWLLWAALLGLLFLLLAMTGRLRILFFLWSLAVFAVLLRGFLLTPYAFTGPVTLKAAVYLTLGALLGAIGAWPWKEREPVRKPVKW